MRTPRRLALSTLLGFAAAALAQPAIDVRPVPAGDRTSRLPKDSGWEHGAFMEIFVRAFRDSDGDGIGDLRGLTQSLDHLQELGIRGLWLMPITKNADGDHGYATTDFRDIAPEYGTLADFDELLRQAHARGIGVIMDYVINHSAAQHPMFVEARQGRDNPWRDWYVWSDTAPQGWDIWGKDPWYHAASQPWDWKGEVKDLPKPPSGARDFYFGTFGPHMPDFNLKKPEVLDYHLSSLRFWLNRGLDGFRLDAVPHMIENSANDWNDQPESRRLTKQLQDLIKSYDQRTVVCEATADPQAYGDPAVCGGAFAFGHVQHYVGAAQGRAESVQQVAGYFRQARPTMATFVSNHDIFAGRRLWDQVDGDEAQYRLAAAGYLLQPGTPYVYYGEEIGQAGVPGLQGDLPIRSPYSWTAEPGQAGFTTGQPFRPVAPNAATHNLQAQRADPGSIYHFYKAMIGLRNAHPSIARGSFEHSFADGLLAGWQRRWQGETTLVLINYGALPALRRVADLPPGARLVAAYPAGDAAMAVQRDGAALARLPAQAVQVWLVKAAGSRGARTAAPTPARPVSR
jgi:glycosidase